MEKQMGDLLSFCISSAIGCLDEPDIYGPLRLTEVMVRLLDFHTMDATEKEHEAFRQLKEFIVENKGTCMQSREDFRAFLQQTALRLMEIQDVALLN